MQKCILRLIVDNGLYDSMTDCLLTFPERELEFMGFSIQAHTQMLGEISEQVSGFKQKILIEISTKHRYYAYPLKPCLITTGCWY